MRFDVGSFIQGVSKKQVVQEIMLYNDKTAKYGLALTEKQALDLVETRSYALAANGRIEFGGGIIQKIIEAFCDSPYIYQYNYAEILYDLVENFYAYKNETLDMVNDEELITFMKEKFNGICRGSIDLLSGRELEKMARNLRSGYAFDYSDDEKPEAEEDEYGY